MADAPRRDRPSVVSARPQNFLQWWAFGVDQASVEQRMGRGQVRDGVLEAGFAPRLGHFDFPSHRVPHGYQIHNDRGQLRGGHGEFRPTVPVAPVRMFDWEKGTYLGSKRGWSGKAPAARDNARVVSPIQLVLDKLYIPRRSPRKAEMQSHEYRILFGLVNGHTDPEVVRAIVGGCRKEFFEKAAIRALELVWNKAHEEIERVKAAS